MLALHGGTPVRTAPFPHWPVPDEQAEKGLREVLWSTDWGSTTGRVVHDFERDFAAYQQADHCTCYCNGTVAIDAALRALGVGHGDEVIVPPYTFIATAAAVAYVGAVPVFADIDPATHLIDPERVEQAVTEHTRAIICVHVGGQPADMDALVELGRQHGLPVIEDAAQAHGASWRGRRVGALGDLGTFSFQAGKNITAGEGGAVVTNDPILADRIYSLANVGRVRDGAWYQHELVAYNLRLTEFQGAVLRAQLTRHPEQQRVREANASYLADALAGIPGLSPQRADARVTEHGRHIFIMRAPVLSGTAERDAVLAALRAEGIPALAGYTGLQHNDALTEASRRNAANAGRDHRPADCPVTDRASTDTIWLTHNCLLGTRSDMDDIAAAFDKVLAHRDSL